MNSETSFGESKDVLMVIVEGSGEKRGLFQRGDLYSS